MSTRDQAALRQLEQAIALNDEAIARAGAAAATVTLDQSSVGRLSRMDAMQQQAMAQGQLARLLTRRRQLQAAVARLEAGRFGLCCECGAMLDADRLANDPAVVFCADCMAEREAG